MMHRHIRPSDSTFQKLYPAINTHFEASHFQHLPSSIHPFPVRLSSANLFRVLGHSIATPQVEFPSSEAIITKCLQHQLSSAQRAQHSDHNSSLPRRHSRNCSEQQEVDSRTMGARDGKVQLRRSRAGQRRCGIVQLESRLYISGEFLFLAENWSQLVYGC
jgi:hypothetical protein